MKSLQCATFPRGVAALVGLDPQRFATELITQPKYPGRLLGRTLVRLSPWDVLKLLEFLPAQLAIYLLSRPTLGFRAL